MRVFVDTKFDVTFTFDLSNLHKLSYIKEQIEKSHGIPVSMQKILFNGLELRVDDQKLRAYAIGNNSRLLLLLGDDQVNNHHYAIQGFVPSMASSNYDQVPPSHASAYFLNQDPMAWSNQVQPSHASESFFNQDLLMMPGSNQVLHQTQISPVPPSHASVSLFNQDPRTMAWSNQVQPSHASESFFNQDLLMMPRSNQVLHQTQISPVPPSHASVSLFNQDPRTMAGSNQVPPSHASEAFYNQDRHVSNDGQPEESVLESFSMDEFLARVPEPWTAQETLKMQGIWPVTTGDNVNIQESSGRANKNQDLFQSEMSPPPQKLTIIMTQYDKPGRDFPVDVNASDNVEELRKQLEKIQQKYQLDLPEKGYFFMHKEGVLDDEKSFSMNRVANGDTIEILPEPAIDDFCP